MGTRGSFPGSEADHSPPSSAEVSAYTCTSTPSIRLHGVMLILKKHRDTFSSTKENDQILTKFIIIIIIIIIVVVVVVVWRNTR
jgi:hypothetical protein